LNRNSGRIPRSAPPPLMKIKPEGAARHTKAGNGLAPQAIVLC